MLEFVRMSGTPFDEDDIEVFFLWLSLIVIDIFIIMGPIWRRWRVLYTHCKNQIVGRNLRMDFVWKLSVETVLRYISTFSGSLYSRSFLSFSLNSKMISLGRRWTATWCGEASQSTMPTSTARCAYLYLNSYLYLYFHSHLYSVFVFVYPLCRPVQQGLYICIWTCSKWTHIRRCSTKSLSMTFCWLLWSKLPWSKITISALSFKI